MVMFILRRVRCALWQMCLGRFEEGMKKGEEGRVKEGHLQERRMEGVKRSERAE